ncbi:Fic family protein [Candidatus Gottesmanbacteria bacterium]|nr:Fic family protein [Candidatus Gottesmanbacteria bacterium]
MKQLLSALEVKKRQLDMYQPLPTDLVRNLKDWFKIELTYTSNAIEGNTLSRAETALVVEKGLTVEGKTLVEHLEAVNHAQALQYLTPLTRLTRGNLTQHHILELHRLILQKIDDANAGRCRTVSVRIAGSRAIMPNPAKVPRLMDEFIAWLHAASGNELVVAADAHFKLVSIHPFVDGNGRTARLLMNLLLMQSGYPPAIIRKEDRRRYIASIEAGQLGKSLDDYYTLIFASVDRSLDIYLDAIEEKEEVSKITFKPLIKIGELAKLTDETVPTIRYWTREGLLSVAARSPGGYQLYAQSQVGIVKKIKKFKDKRLTLAEIKKAL